MWTCAEAIDEDRVVRYLQDAMEEGEREAFEVHVLECSECSDLLEAARLARDVLAEKSVAPRPWPLRIPWAASLAAGLAAVAAASFLLLRPQPTPPGRTGAPRESMPSPASTSSPPASAAEADRTTFELTELGRVEPPTYLPVTTRGPNVGDPAFDRAMAHYARREYAAAAEGLRTVVRQRSSAGDAWFFLGVSELMAGRARDARASLARAALLRQPPYADAAAFFGAKAELQLGDSGPARRALGDVAAGGGPYAGEARRLLQRLDRLEAGRP